MLFLWFLQKTPRAVVEKLEKTILDLPTHGNIRIVEGPHIRVYATYTISEDGRIKIQSDFKHYMTEIGHVVNEIVVITFDHHAPTPAILNMVLNFLD